MAIVTKSERIALVATKRELAAWKLCADEAGLSLSEWMRRASASGVRSQRIEHRSQPATHAEPVVP